MRVVKVTMALEKVTIVDEGDLTDSTPYVPFPLSNFLCCCQRCQDPVKIQICVYVFSLPSPSSMHGTIVTSLLLTV